MRVTAISTQKGPLKEKPFNYLDCYMYKLKCINKTPLKYILPESEHLHP